MADICLINDAKIIEKQTNEEIIRIQNNNNSLEKIENQYNSDNSDDKNTNSKTIVTERENKNIPKDEDLLKNEGNKYSVANTTTKKNNNSKTNLVLQEKLKKIFNVREKGKYEYNKQEIPENLKYHSDSDSSEISELRNSKKLKLNNISNPPTNDNLVTPRISVKRQNSGFTKEKSFMKNNLQKETKIKEKNSEEENNSPNIPQNEKSGKSVDIPPITEKNNNKSKEKKFNNFNKKIIDNYIVEMNKNENQSKEEKKEKSTAIKDIIEKLKAKKIEKEELGKKEKEAEEESIMRRKVKHQQKENEKNQENLEKNEINDISKRIKERKKEREKLLIEEQKEEEKIRNEREEKKRKEKEEKAKQEEQKKREIEKQLELERIKEEKRNKNKNEKSINKSRHYKRSSENRFESILLPHKTFRDEKDEEEEMHFFKKNTNNLNSNSHNSNKNSSKEKNIRRKQLELDLKAEINKEEVNKNVFSKVSTGRYNRQQNLNSNELYSRQTNRSNLLIETNNNAYRKPLNKIPNNTRALNVYRPKRTGAVRGRSQEKAGPPNLLLNKINKEAFNNSSNNIFATLNNNQTNNAKNSTRITYTKKRSPVKEGKNFLQLNNSFCGYNNSNNNANTSMIVKNNISSLEINNINNLNSSFDSLMRNYGTSTNNLFYGINSNNSLYNNGNNNTNIFTGMINNSSILNPDSISNLNMNNFNTNNSFMQNIRPQQLFNYDQNSSFNLGYNNSFPSNILNNSYLGMNDINNSFKRNNNYSINIEDLLVLEEKLSEIRITLNKSKIMHNECFEFWNYYYNCSLYCQLEKLFTNVYESNKVHLSINYLLMSIMICYDFSFDIKILNNSFSVCDELLKLNHQNLISIFEHILTKISSDSRDNIWVYKLNSLVNSSKNFVFNEKYSKINKYSMTPYEKIIYNMEIILQTIRVLLKNYRSSKIEKLTSFFKKLNEKTYEDINIFFRENILRVENMNGSVLASIFLKENNNFKTEPAPYLKTINRKPYSLILDLDETLVHFKVNPENESEGVLRVRPGIVEFLDSIDPYYELIVFTAATQEYADLLIDAVEENKIYFEHRLYRQHTVIIDNDFVKDLSRVGRPLDKIVIVDNMPQNFRLQKENGINIKAFWGEEVYDTALIDLAPILINIAKEGGDIRVGLAKYKDEIVKKVTSNISKHTPS